MMQQALLGLGDWLQHVDGIAFHVVNRDWAVPGLDGLMRASTNLGLGPVQLALLLPLYLFGGRAGRRVALLAVLAFAVSGALAQLIKSATVRPRPSSCFTDVRALVPIAYWGSFPSGHTATSFAIAVVIGARYRAWLAPLLLTAALVGYSRVYVGQHFPLDAAGGALIGSATGLACLWQEARIARRLRKAPPEGPEPPAGPQPALPADATAGRPHGITADGDGS